MCTSRIVFVCRVGERPGQDIETPSSFGGSVADTVVEELAASCIWEKENERYGKRRTQPVITICASDLDWLLQRFVLKVRIVWQSYQQGIVLFSLSLSLSLSPSLYLGFPTCRHACSDWNFMDQVFSFPLTYHLPLRHFLFTFFQRMNNLDKTNPHKSKKDDDSYIHRNKRSDPQAIDALLLPPIL